MYFKYPASYHLSYLSISVPKPVFQTELQDKQVKEGDNLTLDVKVPTECMAQVKWYKDDQELKEDYHIAVISAGEMHAVNIFSVSVKDEAVYCCVATNSAGSVHTDCEVLVEGMDILSCSLQCELH